MNEASAKLIRHLTRDDLPDFLALNNGAAPEMSLLDAGRLDQLIGYGGEGCGIYDDGRLLAAALWFDETTRGYDSPNYRWFLDRFDRFTYVDRIVVAPGLRGRGLGHRIYHGVFAAAAAARSPIVACEIYEDPPNPASRAFHEQLGFTIIGRQTLDRGTHRAAAMMVRPTVPGAG